MLCRWHCLSFFSTISLYIYNWKKKITTRIHFANLKLFKMKQQTETKNYLRMSESVHEGVHYFFGAWAVGEVTNFYTYIYLFVHIFFFFKWAFLYIYKNILHAKWWVFIYIYLFDFFLFSYSTLIFIYPPSTYIHTYTNTHSH